MPRAEVTLRMVAKLGLPCPESALAGGVELAVAVDIHHHVALALKKIDPLRRLYTPAPGPACKTPIQNSNVERQISKRLRETQLTTPARPRNRC
jgi:hypothetical protein